MAGFKPTSTSNATFNRPPDLREPPGNSWASSLGERRPSFRRRRSDDEQQEVQTTKVPRTENSSRLFLDKAHTLSKDLSNQLDMIIVHRGNITEINEADPMTVFMDMTIEFMKKSVTTINHLMENPPIAISSAVLEHNSYSQVTKRYIPKVTPAQANQTDSQTSHQVNNKPSKSNLKFSLEDSDKSTLLFDLDLGKTPIANAQKIASEATNGLLKAARAKFDTEKIFLDDADMVSATWDEVKTTLDDTLSLVTVVPYARETKHNGKPEKPYFTAPIKFVCKSFSEKVMVENRLRKFCDIKCATPINPLVRKEIERFKHLLLDKYSGQFTEKEVRIKTDADKLRMYAQVKNTSKFEFSEEMKNSGKIWVKITDTLDLDPELLNRYQKQTQAKATK